MSWPRDGPAAIHGEVKMSRTARKKVQRKKAQPARKTAKSAPKAARDRVITFRLSADEASLIARAADREPLARYSRRAVLAAAEAASKPRK